MLAPCSDKSKKVEPFGAPTCSWQKQSFVPSTEPRLPQRIISRISTSVTLAVWLAWLHSSTQLLWSLLMQFWSKSRPQAPASKLPTMHKVFWPEHLIEWQLALRQRWLSRVGKAPCRLTFPPAREFTSTPSKPELPRLVYQYCFIFKSRETRSNSGISQVAQTQASPRGVQERQAFQIDLV